MEAQMNKKLKISLPILITIVISVAVTTILIKANSSSENNQQNYNQETRVDKIYININEQKFEVNLEDNSTTSALAKILPLEYTMNDLNGNEKYVYLDETLPTNPYEPKHIEAGDVMLFGNNCFVVFYKSFDTNYSYSKIGHIDNLPELDNGSLFVRLSIE